MLTIVLCYPANQRQVDRIKAIAGADFEVLVSDQERIHQDIFNAHVYCGHARTDLDWLRIVEAGRLRWIQSSAAGLDHCLDPAIVESSVIVTGASGLFAPQVAEHAVALLLALIRRLPIFVRAQQERVFERLPTDDLRGKSVGIVGFGGNGHAIAARLAPFGVRISATDCFPESANVPGVRVLPANQLLELLWESNVVIATLPLTSGTRMLIDAKAFAALPAASYFINVGRGQTVDETALVAALHSGHLAGAGLDVVTREPLPPESELWSLDNVLITPHVGAQSCSRYDDVTKLFCDNLIRFREMQPLLNLVDKRLGFPRPEHRLAPKWFDESPCWNKGNPAENKP